MRRRDLFQVGLAGTFGFLASRFSRGTGQATSSTSDDQSIEKFGGKTKAFLLGAQGGRYPGGRILYPASEGVLSEIDLKTGAIKQSHHEIEHAHYIHALVNDRLFLVPNQKRVALVVDRDHRVEKRLLPPEGYIFGGHAITTAGMIITTWLPEKPHIGLSGKLVFYDEKTLELHEAPPIIGTSPHDMILSPSDPNILYVTYGRFDADFIGHPQENDPIVSRVNLKERKTEKEFRDFRLKGLNHITVTKNESIYTSQLQLGTLAESTLTDLAKLYPNEKWSWGDYSSTRFEGITLPCPLMQFNKDGSAREIITAPGDYLRNQDITYSAYHDMVYSTYSESNCIVRIDSKQNVTSHRGETLKIFKVRGVRPIPGTPLMVANDNDQGMSIFHGETMELVRHYPAKVYLSRHVTLV